MSPRLRPLIYLVLVLCVILGSSLLVERFDRQDKERALMIVSVARFGEKTWSRMDKWLLAHRVSPTWKWHASAPGLFDLAVPVRLSVESEGRSEVYRFRVNPESRQVSGVDEETRDFLNKVTQWARTL